MKSKLFMGVFHEILPGNARERFRINAGKCPGKCREVSRKMQGSVPENAKENRSQ